MVTEWEALLKQQSWCSFNKQYNNKQSQQWIISFSSVSMMNSSPCISCFIKHILGAWWYIICHFFAQEIPTHVTNIYVWCEGLGLFWKGFFKALWNSYYYYHFFFISLSLWISTALGTNNKSNLFHTSVDFF